VGAVWVLHPQKWREEGKVKQHLSGPIWIQTLCRSCICF